MSFNPRQLAAILGGFKIPLFTDSVNVMDANGVTKPVTLEAIVDLAESLLIQGFKRVMIQPGKVEVAIGSIPATIFPDVPGPLSIDLQSLLIAEGSVVELWIRVPLRYFGIVTPTYSIDIMATITDDDDAEHDLFGAAAGDDNNDNMKFVQSQDDDELNIRIFASLGVDSIVQLDVQTWWKSNLDYLKNKIFGLSIGTAGPWVIDIVASTDSGAGPTFEIMNPTIDVIHAPTDPI